MPTRLLRDGILESEAVCSLPWAAEVLYRRLMSVADDYGRFSASPKLIRANCYPLQIDKVSDSDVGKWLAQVAEAGLVRVYPAEDGKRYLEIVKFGQQVRSKSKHPAPPDGPCENLQTVASNCEQTPANAHLDVFVSEGVSVDASPAAPASEQRASRLPPDWVLPSDWAEWASGARPDLDPHEVAEQFRDFWCAKPGKDGRKLDWLATWRNWVKNQRQQTARRPQPSESGFL